MIGRRHLPLVAFSLFLAGVTAPHTSASAQDRAQASGSAAATVVAPITVREIEPLRFGTVATGDTGGTLTLSPSSGATSVTGSLRSICPSGSSCTASPGIFDVRGEAGRSYRVTAPAQAVAARAGGGGTLNVTSITIATQSVPGPGARGTLDDAGNDRFKVGGTLQVAPDSTAGTYVAEMEMVVSYD